MPGPVRTVAEDYCRDTIVALPHHKVSKAGNFIDHCFFGYLEYMPKKIGIATEIPDCIKSTPSDGIPCLPAAE